MPGKPPPVPTSKTDRRRIDGASAPAGEAGAAGVAEGAEEVEGAEGAGKTEEAGEAGGRMPSRRQ